MSKHLFAPAFALTALLAACGGSSFDSGAATGSVSPGDPCELGGDTAAADDGCNTCTCEGGQWACTEKACATGGAAGSGGRPGEGGAAGAGVPSTGGLWGGAGSGAVGGATTGGAWGAGGGWSGGTAGFPSSGGAAGAPGVCMPGAARFAPDGCSTCTCMPDGFWACTDSQCVTCTEGESIFDGCNTCSCSGGQWMCTMRACVQECPPPAAVDPAVACAAVVVYARDPLTGTCCEYGSPCTAPSAWAQFYDLASCTNQGAVDGGAADKGCGGWLGDTCSSDEYCAYEEGQICGAADASAFCRPRPDACDTNLAPVCGCNGVSYSNACVAAMARTGVLYAGSCTAQ